MERTFASSEISSPTRFPVRSLQTKFNSPQRRFVRVYILHLWLNLTISFSYMLGGFCSLAIRPHQQSRGKRRKSPLARFSSSGNEVEAERELIWPIARTPTARATKARNRLRTHCWRPRSRRRRRGNEEKSEFLSLTLSPVCVWVFRCCFCIPLCWGWQWRPTLTPLRSEICTPTARLAHLKHDHRSS
jgi:hypothetical protein